MLTKGQACTCTDSGQQCYEYRYRERVIKRLTKRAHTFGFQRVPAVAQLDQKPKPDAKLRGRFLSERRPEHTHEHH